MDSVDGYPGLPASYLAPAPSTGQYGKRLLGRSNRQVELIIWKLRL
jgi:hypothetical protein